MITITQIPPNETIAGLIPVVLLVIVGLVFWAAGRRVLRTGFALLALIAGGAIGWILGTGIDLGLHPALWAAVLGLLFGCTAALTYRLAIARALALVCGLASPLAVAAVAELQPGSDRTTVAARAPDAAPVLGAPEPRLFRPDAPPPMTPPEPTDRPSGLGSAAPADRGPDPADPGTGNDDWLFGLDPDFGSYAERAAPAVAAGTLTEHLGIDDETAASIEGAGARARTWADTVAVTLQSWWDARPEHLRPVLIGAAAAGALAGLLFGTLSSTLAAAIVSAFGGSILWLGGLRVVLEHFGAEFVPQTSQSATIALAAWIVVALVGTAIQWRIGPAPADTSA